MVKQICFKRYYFWITFYGAIFFYYFKMSLALVKYYNRLEYARLSFSPIRKPISR